MEMLQNSYISSSVKVCFNLNCKQALEHPKNGWRLRSSGFAELCDRCGSAYEEGKFCEIFHLNASGWRCCETCGTQIHCGCVVSFHMFVLLDAGGIECLTCTRKKFVLTPNSARPLLSLGMPSNSARPLPSLVMHSDSARPLPSLVMPYHPERIKDLSGKNWGPIAGSGALPWLQASSLFSGYKKIEQAKASFEFDGPKSADVLHFSDKMSALSIERQNNEDSIGRLSSSEKTWGADVLENIFSASSRSLTTSTLLAKKSSNHIERGASTDNQVHSGKAKGDARERSHLLARYSPRITDPELLQISGENHIITPLFEKTLSVSDAGRIGRLVLPKKCAEVYLPSISHPEGLPLEVRDVKGNEWLFQFRFWPNNNSRMYVLEGVTPCIQSLQLQAGDIVTFSRLEPEGKLMMGGRKASGTTSTDQGNEAIATSGGISANGMNIKKSTKRSEKDLTGISKPEERVDVDVCNRTKRKSSMLASKNKNLMIDNCSMVELKLTLKEAQGLIRPPPGNAPKVIVIEDCLIEEYEDEPIIGRPSIPSSDFMGEEIKWVQCDDCLKWRKLAADILLPSKWTCSANLWDEEKSMCSAAQELSAEHLADLLPAITSFKKTRVSKLDSDSVETLDGLDALANLAAREEGTSLKATTGHPRHKPGCGCIVCMQPPSGKGPKHKQSCDCIVCESVKRRFRTLMTRRREKQQLEKDAEMTLQKLEQDTDIHLLGEVLTGTPNQDVLNHDSSGKSIEKEISASPSNPAIDLNSQPERDKQLAQLASGSDLSSMFHLLHEPTGIHLQQQNQSCQSPSDAESLGVHGSHQNGLMSSMFSSCISFDGRRERIDMDHHSILPADIVAASASTSQ